MQRTDSGDIHLEPHAGYWSGGFTAMASPCRVLVESDDAQLAARLTRTARGEALRIERKFSRYRPDSVVSYINTSGGNPVEVDSETANLLDYAARCFELSGGLFDITSGVLREVWRFDGGSGLPEPRAVERVRRRVGWSKCQWRRPWLTLPAGMEIDLGGVGKEYAVDRCAQLLRQHTAASLVVNFGGDLRVTGPRRDGSPWRVAVEDPRHDGAALGRLAITAGALATSGDARRYRLHEGRRYGHILDPRSGWPVQGGPRSVTVCADSCMEAGMLATFAILHGAAAEEFLRAQGVPYWIT